jgi:hypothetical protein
MLGIAYAGMIDDVAFFRRALTANEVHQLYRLRRGVAELH